MPELSAPAPTLRQAGEDLQGQKLFLSLFFNGLMVPWEFSKLKTRYKKSPIPYYHHDQVPQSLL